MVLGLVRARQGNSGEAESLLRQAIAVSEGTDYVTQELCIELLGMEEEHRRQFRGFLKEYEK